MCGMCPDVYGGCNKIECGALPPVREDGTRRQRYMRWFTYGQTPCEHVAAEHVESCPVRIGNPCECPDEDDDDPEPTA